MSEDKETGVEDSKQYQGDSGTVKRWLREIELVKKSKQQEAFEKTGKRIVKQFRGSDEIASANDPQAKASQVMFNILHSNVQILKPTLFARIPRVVVERLHKSNDPVARLACLGAERATYHQIQSQQDRWFWAVKQAVEDRLLPGRGQVWLRYEAEFEDATADTVEASGQEVAEEDTQQLKVGSEKVVIDPLCWLDYIHSPARNPFEVRWMARRVYMTRAELKERFGDIGAKVDLNAVEGKKKDDFSKEEKEFILQAEVWEIEDFESKQRIWVSEGYKDSPLDVKPDVLKMKDFFSCPRIPLLATTTSDSMYPTPDYVIYERLAEELEYVNKRIASMVECIRVVGAVAAQHSKDIKNVLALKDGQLWPIDNWQSFADKQGFKGVIDWLPFDQALAAIPVLQQRKAEIENDIAKIMGISEILRGTGDPTETATSTQMKGHFAVIQISEKQQDVQRFCRDIISKMAEIIFEPGLFSDQTIYEMVGVAQMSEDDQRLWPQALQLLRDDRLRTFRVDIETDSTIAMDEDLEIEKRLQFVNAIQSLTGNIQNVAQFRPELIKPLIESTKFAIAAFRTGKAVEGAFDSAWQAIEDADEQAAANPPQQPPDYEGQKLQLEAQALQLKGDIESQKLQLEGQKAQMGFQIDSQRLQIEGMKVQSQAQIDAMDQELQRFKEQFVQFTETQRLELEKYQTDLSMKEKFLEEARLQQQERIETMKLAAGQAEGAKEHKIPQVHIYNGSGKKRVIMSRTPTGELVGEASDVEA